MIYNNQLTDSQRKAVFHKDGPLLVIAGPGSGKTCVITTRIAALIDSGVSAYNICAITFTNKAAEEMRKRVFALGIASAAHISTFHSLCVRLLRRYAVEAGIKPNFSIYDAADQARCIKRAVKDCDLDTTNFSPARMLDAVSTLKNKLIDAESFKALADDFFSEKLAAIYLLYQNILNQANALDFDDLLMKTAILLKENHDICNEIGTRYKYLLVDEYQDTNHAQYEIAKSIASAHRNICVTGDPDQSIYRWRGADIRNILAFESDWPDAVIVKLEENFRSTPNILHAADNLIAYNQNRKEKKLVPTKPQGRDIALNIFEDEHQEACGVVEQLGQLIESGTSPRDIAVFYRVNSASRVLEEAFIKSEVSYQIVRGVEFYRRKEIRDLLAYLKVLANPSDEVALLRIINTPARGIGKTTIDRLQAYANLNKVTLFDALKKAPKINSLGKAAKAKIAVFINMLEQFNKDINDKVAPLAERIFVETGLEQSLQQNNVKNETTIENIYELINSAAQYDKDTENPSLIDYLQQISLFSDTDSYDITSEHVAMMTLHSAKGLEFENVFIVGLDEGRLPHENSSEDIEEIEEERRLFFVGITRAKSSLYISYPRYRVIRGQLLRTNPSPFLYELGIDFAEPQQQNHCSFGEIDYCDEDEEDIIFDMPKFVVGQLVRHKIFGLGRVRDVVDMGEDSIIVIKFNTGQTKSLMLKYADLTEP